MLVIRLQRIGKKGQPSYRLVVAEKRSKLIAPPAEDLGSYDPRTKEMTVNKERVSHWMQKGAKPSPTVHNLFVTKGVLSAPKMEFKFPIKPAEAAAPGAATETTPSESAPEAVPAEAPAETQ